MSRAELARLVVAAVIRPADGLRFDVCSRGSELPTLSPDVVLLIYLFVK